MDPPIPPADKPVKLVTPYAKMSTLILDGNIEFDAPKTNDDQVKSQPQAALEHLSSATGAFPLVVNRTEVTYTTAVSGNGDTSTQGRPGLSFRNILQRTTRKPLWVHPLAWRPMHIILLGIILVAGPLATARSAFLLPPSLAALRAAAALADDAFDSVLALLLGAFRVARPSTQTRPFCVAPGPHHTLDLRFARAALHLRVHGVYGRRLAGGGVPFAARVNVQAFAALQRGALRSYHRFPGSRRPPRARGVFALADVEPYYIAVLLALAQQQRYALAAFGIAPLREYMVPPPSPNTRSRFAG